MSEEPIAEGTLATGTGDVSQSNLVALGGAVFRILSYQRDCMLFVEAENIETFEHVLLTIAANQTGSPVVSAAKKRRRNRESR